MSAFRVWWPQTRNISLLTGVTILWIDSQHQKERLGGGLHTYNSQSTTNSCRKEENKSINLFFKQGERHCLRLLFWYHCSFIWDYKAIVKHNFKAANVNTLKLKGFSSKKRSLRCYTCFTSCLLIWNFNGTGSTIRWEVFGTLIHVPHSFKYMRYSFSPLSIFFTSLTQSPSYDITPGTDMKVTTTNLLTKTLSPTMLWLWHFVQNNNICMDNSHIIW